GCPHRPQEAQAALGRPLRWLPRPHPARRAPRIASYRKTTCRGSRPAQGAWLTTALSLRDRRVKSCRTLILRLLGRILKQIETLVGNPRPSGVAKLEGANDLWRVRVGEWRVVYRISDRERLVDVISVRHRRDAYR